MIERIGIGIDVVDINRFNKKPFHKNKNFYKKIFNDSEIQYCLNHKNHAQHFAGKFAIKEALIKSIKEKTDFLNILINYDDEKPTVSLINDKSYRFIVSLSHEKSHAIAVVLSECKIDTTEKI